MQWHYSIRCYDDPVHSAWENRIRTPTLNALTGRTGMDCLISTCSVTWPKSERQPIGGCWNTMSSGPMIPWMTWRQQNICRRTPVTLLINCLLDREACGGKSWHLRGIENLPGPHRWRCPLQQKPCYPHNEIFYNQKRRHSSIDYATLKNMQPSFLWLNSMSTISGQYQRWGIQTCIIRPSTST